MSRGYWSIILAAFGWLILAAAQAPNNEAQTKQADPGRQAEQSLRSIAASQNRIAEASDTGEYQQPCDEAEPNNSSDLCAQWYAAHAARDAADWAGWALAVGLAGAAGIVLALLLTVDSNRIARVTAKRQLRAYVGLDAFEIEFNQGKDGKVVGGRFKIAWTNAGQTPATGVRDDAHWQCFDGEIPADFDFPDSAAIAHVGSTVLGPGQEFATHCPDLLSLADFAAVAAKEKRLYIWAWVDYTDAFSERRRTEIAAVVQIEALADAQFDVKFDALQRHNAVDGGCMKKPSKDESEHRLSPLSHGIMNS
jgi:hypothetical protein